MLGRTCEIIGIVEDSGVVGFACSESRKRLVFEAHCVGELGLRHRAEAGLLRPICQKSDADRVSFGHTCLRRGAVPDGAATVLARRETQPDVSI